MRTSSIARRARDSNIRPRASEQASREQRKMLRHPRFSRVKVQLAPSGSLARSRNPIPLEKWGKIFPKKENAMMK